MLTPKSSSRSCESLTVNNHSDSLSQKKPFRRTRDTIYTSQTILQKFSLILLVLLVVFSPVANQAIAASSQPDGTSVSETETTAPIVANATVPVDQAASDALEINGKAYVLYEVESNTFLLGRNADQPLSPASITKVMTMLLALENLELKDEIVVRREMFETIPNDYMRLGLVEGETITVEDAIYGSMLLSANDTSMALALKVSPSVEKFCDLMNARAKELGCTATTFTNPYGLAETTNLTTAHDMALIMAEALKHEDFIRIGKAKTYLLPATDKTGARGMTNGNRFIKDPKYAAYTPHLSSKTGFTNLSGNTIVSGARQDGRTLVGVILGATSSIPRYDNLITLFNHGFNDFSTVPVDKESYTRASNDFIKIIESEIAASKLMLEITASTVKLTPFITNTNSRTASGSSAVVGEPDVNRLELAGLKSGGKLEYPLKAKYSDQTYSEAGSLILTLQAKAPVSSSGSGTVTGTNLPGSSSPAAGAVLEDTTTGNLILRIVLIALAGLVLAAIIIYVMMRREIKRRRRQRHLAGSANNYGVRKVRFK